MPLLQCEAAGKVRATTIMHWLEEKFPGRFNVSQLRTLPVASPSNVTEILAAESCSNQ